MLMKYNDVMTPYYSLFDHDPFKIVDDILYSTRGQSKSNFRVETTDAKLTLSIDLPGVKSSDLDVKTTGKSITVSGKLRGEDFRQAYRISKEYDAEAVDASLEDGVLTLTFNRVVANQMKSIPVKVK